MLHKSPAMLVEEVFSLSFEMTFCKTWKSAQKKNTKKPESIADPGFQYYKACLIIQLLLLQYRLPS
jgi:hypothetical protein